MMHIDQEQLNLSIWGSERKPPESWGWLSQKVEKQPNGGGGKSGSWVHMRLSNSAGSQKRTMSQTMVLRRRKERERKSQLQDRIELMI
jgi:hypothetical protein